MNAVMEVLLYFLKLGILGFGGPLAVVSAIQNDLVYKKKWIEEDEFNSAFAMIKAMPGPVAFMSAVFMGRHRAGFLGGAAAGFGMVFPAFVLMIFFALGASAVKSHPNIETFFLGMQIATLGVILASLKGLVGPNSKNKKFWFLVSLSGFIFWFYPQSESLIILSFALIMVFKDKIRFHKLNTFLALSPLSLDLFWTCFKAGALVFGTGLAIVPMLQHDVVDKFGWLSQSEFLDALAFGQLTPGPVVITVTYVGYKLDGFSGAILATVGIFLASFIHLSTWFPIAFRKLRQSKWVYKFTFGALSAVVGPIIVTTFKLGQTIDVHWGYFILSVFAFWLSLKNKIPVWGLIPLAGGCFLMINLLLK